MNVFIYELAGEEVAPAPEITPRKFVVEDNVGESIHIHLRNFRLELSVEEFDTFADNLVTARNRMSNGNR